MTRRKLRARLDEPDAWVPLGKERHGDAHVKLARSLERALGHELRGPAPTAERRDDDALDLVEILRGDEP